MARLKPKTQVKRPVFSWSSGKEVVDRDTIHRGWFIDAGLDDALDGAAAAAGWPADTMRHRDGSAPFKLQRELWGEETYQMLEIAAPGHPLDGQRGNTETLYRLCQRHGAVLGAVDERVVSLMDGRGRGVLSMDGSVYPDEHTAFHHTLRSLGLSDEEIAQIFK